MIKNLLTRCGLIRESVTAQNLNLRYFLNDPSTPHLVEEQKLPTRPNGLPFNVLGFTPEAINSSDQDIIKTVNCYITVCRSIVYFQNIMSNVQKPLMQWQGNVPLVVNPKARGGDINAFYDRRNLSFCFGRDPATKRDVYTSESVDVVAHELGHALLDALKPDIWNLQVVECWAFHEAFADINALVTMMQSDTILNVMLEETKGDLMQSNIVSRLAESMAIAMYNIDGKKKGRSKEYLRDATVRYNYVDPHKLPHQAQDGVLAAECHSFGRVFLGAWYEIFAKIFEQLKPTKDSLSAIKMARDITFSYLLKAILQTPATIKFTEAIAKNMIIIAELKGNLYSQIIRTTFIKRKIIIPEVKMLNSDLTWNDLKGELKGNDQVFKKGNSIIVNRPQIKRMKISNHFISALSTAAGPLYDIEMELPADTFYQFNQDGNLIEKISVSESELVESMVSCAILISQQNELGENKKWFIENGKLIRKFFD